MLTATVCAVRCAKETRAGKRFGSLEEGSADEPLPLALAEMDGVMGPGLSRAVGGREEVFCTWRTFCFVLLSSGDSTVSECLVENREPAAVRVEI